MAGIHLHTHDIMDEGTGQILRLIRRMGNSEFIFTQVNTIFERNPSPTGNLPHNPVHEVVVGQGTLHVNINSESIHPALFQKVAESISADTDPMAILKSAMDGTEFKVIPWVNIMNGEFAGNIDNNCVVDFRGEQVRHWLCPNGPDVVPMWSKILDAITKKYGYTTYLIDRIRFPDWAGKALKPQSIFSCFCANCLEKMLAEGLDVSRLRKEMNETAGLLKTQQFDDAVLKLQDSEMIQQWVTFRQNSVSAFIERLVEETVKINPNIRLWIDLWPPAYSWLLGQDYGRLTRSSNTLKHFPYHKLGGGADVQGFIRYFADTPDQQEAAFQAFMKFFSLNYEISYEYFKNKGFPIEFVKNENLKVRQQSQPGTFIFSGIQMWNISPEDLSETIEAAESSEADDLLYYSYGWADEELFDVVGNRQRKS